MKTLLIIFLIILCTAIIAQESRGMTGKTQQKIEQSDKSKSNVIDYKNPAQKVKPVKLVNHEGELIKQNRKFGFSASSGPVETLEKKSHTETQLNNSQLREHLYPKKVMRPNKINPEE